MFDKFENQEKIEKERNLMISKINQSREYEKHEKARLMNELLEILAMDVEEN